MPTTTYNRSNEFGWDLYSINDIQTSSYRAGNAWPTEIRFWYGHQRQKTHLYIDSTALCIYYAFWHDCHLFYPTIYIVVVYDLHMNDNRMYRNSKKYSGFVLRSTFLSIRFKISDRFRQYSWGVTRETKKSIESVVRRSYFQQITVVSIHTNLEQMLRIYNDRCYQNCYPS